MRRTSNPPAVTLELLVEFTRNRRGWPRQARLRRQWIVDLWRDDDASYAWLLGLMDRVEVYGQAA